MKAQKDRLILLAMLFVLSTLLRTTPTVADNFPEKPITLILASGPGGGSDIALKQVQPFLEKALGGNIVFQYQPGGGTAVANTIAAKSKPDGYTIVDTGYPYYQFTFITQKVDYKFEDLTPVGPYYMDTAIIRVRRDAPWNNLKELIDYAKSKPPRTLKASVSERTSNHFLALKQLEEATGISFNIVPFGGGNPARLALLGGQVDLTNCGVFNSLAIAEKSKVIAVQYPENKWPELTDNAKTVNEQLGTNLPNSNSIYVLAVPSKIKKDYPERYQKLVKALNQALTDKDYIAQMNKLGIYGQVFRQDPESCEKEGRAILEEYKKYKDLFVIK